MLNVVLQPNPPNRRGEENDCILRPRRSPPSIIIIIMDRWMVFSCANRNDKGTWCVEHAAGMGRGLQEEEWETSRGTWGDFGRSYERVMIAWLLDCRFELLVQRRGWYWWWWADCQKGRECVFCSCWYSCSLLLRRPPRWPHMRGCDFPFSTKGAARPDGDNDYGEGF